VAAQELQVGTVSFANSGAPEAQETFQEGIALLHNFEYPRARIAFRRAQELDPTFAMAYWGEAMTFNAPLWYRQQREEAAAALAGLAATPAERIALAPTEREKAWLGAVEILFGEGEKEARDDSYAEAMADLNRKYPEDPEAAAFYALAILGTAHEGRDHRTYMRAAAIAGPVFHEDPDHPGAAHYLIHSFDDPVHAPLGLPAARAYSEIAPDAGHAQHMTSHIFVALGMWDDVVRANERAVAVESRGARERGEQPTSCYHYNEWLLYGYLMQDRPGEAAEILRGCQREAAESSGRALSSFAEMRSRYVLDTEEWSGAEATLTADFASEPGARLTDAFLRGYRAARLGKLPDAVTALDELRRARPAAEVALRERGRTEAAYVRRPKILEIQLVGLVQLLDGGGDRGLASLREAAELEGRLPFAFGPPVIEKPSYELLGEVLLEWGQVDGALAAFATALTRAPGRRPARTGLAAAEEARDNAGASAGER
jgi:tetratricopeptide (TPR) repeat protein